MAFPVLSGFVDCTVVESLRENSGDVARINSSVGWKHYTEIAVSMPGVVAKVAEKVIGYVSIHRGEGFAHIVFIAVHSEHKGQGIGYQLLEKTVRDSQEKGLSCLSLTCRVDKVGEFYRKCGAKLGLSYLEEPSAPYGFDRGARFSYELLADHSENKEAV